MMSSSESPTSIQQ